ncbi:DnaJ C-terminal domain-containing protein [Polaromonas aquatica]|uniref:DnaJ C-terminal domain-containing protein n=1 Tax=Polaromonas aquatica TaxID=332657 RepID=UPI003D65B5F2
MEYKDYYKIMGVERSATTDEIKKAHRRLARKYHPDVSKEKNAEARFKEIAEAYEVLRDPEKRAAYDQLGASYQAGQDFRPPPGWNPGRAPGGRAGGTRTRGAGDFDHSDFFDAIFRGMGGAGPEGWGGFDDFADIRGSRGGRGFDMHGQDQHAKIQIDIGDSYSGATRKLQLRMPVEDETGVTMQDRTIEFVIPRGIRAGQHIRLAGQGSPGVGQGSPGDLYLDVEFLPHALYRAEGHDVYMNLPVTPWEAALGAEVEAPTPAGVVALKIPPGSASGRKLRLKGRGLPGKTPGDFYFVLQVVLPDADTAASKKAYEDMAAAFKTFKPRASLRNSGGKA